jgi:hypothetical protein
MLTIPPVAGRRAARPALSAAFMVAAAGLLAACASATAPGPARRC